MTKSKGTRRGAYWGFDGEIGRTFSESTPSWPAETSARPGSRNIRLMLADDLGYSDVGCFGGEIPTPNIDAIAAQDIRFTNFHTSPKYSPSRASLLTGVDHHLAGFADVAHFDPGYPNYRMELGGAPTIGERLRDEGYSTLMVGKWHLLLEAQMSVDAPRRNWPLQNGFDEYYGILDGFNNQHDPHQLVDGNSIRISIGSAPRSSPNLNGCVPCVSKSMARCGRFRHNSTYSPASRPSKESMLGSTEDRPSGGSCGRDGGLSLTRGPSVPSRSHRVNG